MPADEHHPDLLGLLRGELDNAETVAAGAHLERCEPCRDELAGTAVGHALLRRSGRALGGVEPDAVLPAMVPPGRRPRRPVLAAVAAAAVVGVLLGGVATAALTDRSPSPSRPSPEPSAPSALAIAALAPVKGSDRAAGGEVELSASRAEHTRMRIRTSHLPPAGAGRFYYAWLLDPRTQKMLPLGQVGPDGGSFEVADGTLAVYSAVDISLEEDDGDAGHSVTSVLRGRY